MRVVRLSEEELTELRQVAEAIHESKRRIPAPDWGVDGLESRFLSLCAERCVARLLGCEHVVVVLPGGDGHVDLVLPCDTTLGRTVEVKFRRTRRSDLATSSLRFWEELVADLYVLVWPTADEGWSAEQGFTVVGFATRRQFHDRIVARPPVKMRGEKWEIPWQELQPIDLLIEEVRGGAPVCDSREIRVGEVDAGGSSVGDLRSAA